MRANKVERKKVNYVEIIVWGIDGGKGSEGREEGRREIDG